MKILFIGDIVGEPGRHAVKDMLPKIKKSENIEFVIANCENAAAGSGVTPALADELFDYGVDVLTSGDHIWKRKEIYDKLSSDARILRPANYPSEAPGSGSTVIRSESGTNVGVINLIGRVFMQPVECPFKTVKREVEKLKNKAQVIVVDMHAEATSEKIALGWYLDGLVSAIVGTHTHVQTADEKI
ncbi:MAG: TIGR00282 family metallophosphoesterase, partial [Candidatus Omnitrophota bacterium]|nr:TIGR00282 family metallophosphoesterase [Candidatus Omnitrophota bacterium]